LFEFFNGSKVDQQSLEARLNGGNEKLNWTAGVYGLRIAGTYYEAGLGRRTSRPRNSALSRTPTTATLTWARAMALWQAPYWTTGGVPGPDGGIPETKSPYDLTTKSYAVFGQLEYRASDLIGFTVGARFTGDKKDYNFSWYPYEYFPTAVTNQTLLLHQPDGATLTSYSSSRSDNLYSGKAQMDLHLSKDMLAYVSYNRGVKGGGFNAPLFPIFINDLKTLSFKPENADLV